MDQAGHNKHRMPLHSKLATCLSLIFVLCLHPQWIKPDNHANHAQCSMFSPSSVCASLSIHQELVIWCNILVLLNGLFHMPFLYFHHKPHINIISECCHQSVLCCFMCLMCNCFFCLSKKEEVTMVAMPTRMWLYHREGVNHMWYYIQQEGKLYLMVT
jgi:hypothetical protein